MLLDARKLLLVTLLVSIGCDSVNPPAGDDGASILGASAVETGDAISVASDEQASGSPLSIKTGTPFCCDSNERVFQALFDQEPLSPFAVCMWEFGNGRTEEGCEVSHTFGFNGVYEANLIVRLPSGRQETTNFEVVIGDVESFVEPAGVFGTGNEPGSDTVPAGNADDPAQDPPSDNETNADPVDNTDPRDQAPDDIDDQTQPDFETDDNPVDDETPDEEPVDVEILSVDAGDDVVVFSGRPVALDGLVTYTSMSGMPAISWQQRGGPPVVWPESRYASDARLIVPMVSQVAEIELALVATADDQAGGTQIVEDTLRITVEPIPASLELDDPRWADQLSDDTTSLQQALDSGASTITVPATGLRTVYETLLVRDDTTLILEPGVVIHAAPDEFHGIFDSLMEVHEVRNVTIHGNGATMRMRREGLSTVRVATHPLHTRGGKHRSRRPQSCRLRW